MRRRDWDFVGGLVFVVLVILNWNTGNACFFSMSGAIFHMFIWVLLKNVLFFSSFKQMYQLWQ